eukprot:3705714-Alexandrium_andersonii.AAC.1
MSASLVGSEMCIRDRDFRHRPRFGVVASRGVGWRGIRPLRSREGAWRGAVSYTHLTLPTICSV